MAIDIRDEHDNSVRRSRIEHMLYRSGITLAMPAKYIIDLMEKHGLKWQE